MGMKTSMSLAGFIATDPDMNFTKDGNEYSRARIGIEHWRKEVDGTFTQLESTFHDLVAFDATARELHARFRPGDSFLAAGYVHEYEDPKNPGEIKEQFVARKIGHNATRTTYDVHRPEAAAPEADQSMSASAQQTAPAPAIGV